jgi:hypothetical protein
LWDILVSSLQTPIINSYPMEVVKMNRCGKVFMNKTVIFFSTLVATFSVSTAVNAEQLAEIVVGTDYVEWMPIDTSVGGFYTLSVSSPNGVVVKNSFASSESPVYLSTLAEPFVDGVYNYELVLNPATLPAARQIGGVTDENGRTRNASMRSAATETIQTSSQTGNFSVLDGSVIDPDINE